LRKASMKNESEIDVFITFHKKDAPALPLCVQSIERYLVPRPHRITLLSDDVSSDLLTKYDLNHIHESSVFEKFSFEEMPYMECRGRDRTGWYFQQFLKWEARRHSTTENYVVVDADTVFIKPAKLFHRDKYIFHRGDQYHLPYFKTYEKLFGYLPEKQRSFIANYMIFNTKIIGEIIAGIEKTDTTRKWYEIVLDTIDTNEPSSFSEFETYGYYMSKHYPDLFCSKNCPNKIVQSEKISRHFFNMIRYRLRGYTSISYHCYKR